MKYNDNGTYKDIYVKSFDTLPVGAELDYDGQTVPDGWTQVDDEPIYSTTEQRCGTWINGKPLYRKVFETEKITTSSTVIGTKEATDVAVFVYGWFFADNGFVQPIGTYYLNANVESRLFCTATGITLHTGSNWVNNDMKARVVFYYYKSTD